MLQLSVYHGDYCIVYWPKILKNTILIEDRSCQWNYSKWCDEVHKSDKDIHNAHLWKLRHNQFRNYFLHYNTVTLTKSFACLSQTSILIPELFSHINLWFEWVLFEFYSTNASSFLSATKNSSNQRRNRRKKFNPNWKRINLPEVKSDQKSQNF